MAGPGALVRPSRGHPRGRTQMLQKLSGSGSGRQCRLRTPCLRRFAVRRTGPVLLFPAEDSLAVVRRRLEGICSAADVDFQSLPVEVITAPTLRLDAPKDRERLGNTVQARQPRLLILDPLIRLHRVDENDASQIAGLLSYLRQLQRTFQVAVLVVHHARKDANGTRPGQALRGSSELHGWGDSNLYMRRRGAQLTLSTEHRAAPSQDHIPLELTQAGSALALSVAADTPPFLSPVLNLRLSSASSRSWPAWINPSPSSSCASFVACVPPRFAPAWLNWPTMAW